MGCGKHLLLRTVQQGYNVYHPPHITIIVVRYVAGDDSIENTVSIITSQISKFEPKTRRTIIKALHVAPMFCLFER